ncbi:MAG TPA: TonB-dependent receptor, partial [Phenylobacterium sp.]
QDVPVAISAFTDERREIVGINTIQDMTNFTPGLVYNSSTDRISLRGVGRLTNVLTGDAAVANYNDGVYETFAVQAGRSTLFLDRVEVLRGPQGTLYGRNSIGGAINQISKRPTEDWYAEVRASAGNYEHGVVEGAISGPITDNIQFRLAANWERQTKGWVDNLVPGMPGEGGVRNEWFGEAQIQGKFFDDKLEVWAKYGQGVWHNGAGGPGSQSEGWTNGPYPNFEFGPDGIQINSGYACSTGFGVTNIVNPSPAGCANPQYDPNGRSKDAARTMARVIPYQVRLPVYNTEAIHVTWHAKDFDIKYVTGGVNYHYVLTGPNETASGNLGRNSSATPVTAFTLASGARVFPTESFAYREYNQFWSHELNLVSTWDKPVQYVLGGYYFNQHVAQPVFTDIAQQSEWNGPFLAPGFFCAATGGVCAPAAGTHRYDNRPRSESTSYAFFGQTDWAINPQWKATLGLRYSHDRKEGIEQVRLICWGAPTCYGVPGEVFGANIPAADITALAVPFPPANNLPRGIVTPTTVDPVTGFSRRNYDASWQATTGTAGIEWQPDEDTNTYFKYSRGYKSGGYYVGIFTFLAPDAYAQKESVDSFELGLKKNFGSRLQTNFATYYYKYENLQVPLAVFSGGQVATNFYNVPKSISKGFEAEITWLPIENLQILFSYSYNDAYVKKGTAIDIADPAAVDPSATPTGPLTVCTPTATGTPPCDPWIVPGIGILSRTQNLKGNRLPNAPKNKFAVNANYTLRDMFGGDIVGSLSIFYRDTQYGTLFTRSFNKAPDWWQTDARVTWTSADDRNRVIVFGKNLFNNLQYDAGAVGARFVGTNIDPTTLAPVRVNQGTFSTYSVAPPRTFGIEVQHKFF